MTSLNQSLTGAPYLLAVLGMVASVTAGAQDAGPLALILPVSARAASLGNAWVAGRDEYGIFFNPALANTAGAPFGLSFARYGNHAFGMAAAAGWTVGPLNLGWGVHMVNLSTSPTAPYPYDAPDMTGFGDADVSSVLGVAAGNMVYKGFRIGLGAKYAHDVAPHATTTSNIVLPTRSAVILGDVGVTRPLWVGLAGLSVQNIAAAYTGGVQKVHVPTQLALGWTATRQWGELDYGFATQVTARRAGWVSPAAGIDVGYGWIEGYSVNGRVGARRTESKNERPVTVGAAFNADRLNVDYGLGFFAGNNAVHRVTLRWR